MKYLFLALISLPILADTNYIKLSELDKCSGGATYYAQKETCGEGCIAIESSDNCKDLELTDNLVLDFIRKEKTDSCLDEADCVAKEAALICDLGKPIRTENEVYCAVEAYKKDGKKLVNNPEKKAAREAAEKAQEEARKTKEESKKAAKERIKALDLSKTLTTKQITDALKDVKEVISE